jgi:hypothetical protein
MVAGCVDAEAELVGSTNVPVLSPATTESVVAFRSPVTDVMADKSGNTFAIVAMKRPLADHFR